MPVSKRFSHVKSPSPARCAGLVLAAGLTTGVALLMGASPASAHVPGVDAACAGTNAVLHVTLKNYNDKHQNQIQVQDNTKVLLDTKFGTSFQHTWTEPGATGHTFKITVRAWDDPTGKKGFSFTDTSVVKVCAPPPSTTPPPTSTPAKPTAPPVASTPKAPPAHPAAQVPVVPKGAPQTGGGSTVDNSPWGTLFAFLAATAAGLGGALFVKRRRGNTQE